ncbi:MAG: tyrosine-type recombinase/integrase [Paracoccaceae bacterium]|nr:tyrosine-type recombinase/integrase [Paracoccaceae bacterium]
MKAKDVSATSRLTGNRFSSVSSVKYRRQKCKNQCTIPLRGDLPDWFPASPFLIDCIESAPKHLTWLSAKRGASRSAKAFGLWFANAARAAGIPTGKTAHGIRKMLAVQMQERGATAEQRMAILGHEASAQTRHYSKTADAKKTIMGTKNSNLSEQVGNNRNLS